MNNLNIENPIGLQGMEFIEYGSPEPQKLTELFKQMGFRKSGQHKRKNVELWSQGRIHFVLNMEPGSFSEDFSKQHGPSVCATGFRVRDSKKAFELAVERGAKPCPQSKQHSFPSVYGIGDSVIYFIDNFDNQFLYKSFEEDFDLSTRETHEGLGLLTIDHLTNNVPKGEMQKWCDFYEKIFGFKETRYFDIKGKATGLYSKVMKSPCGRIIIPINEPVGEKSQIQEYLEEYKGSGIQHIALLTADIVSSVKLLRERGVDFLDTPDTYYDQLLERCPNTTEDVETLKNLRILVDGDHEGYLLQIFTKTVVGPIFYEIIQRKNHSGFGEGNFQALFDAIEADQKKRGYL